MSETPGTWGTPDAQGLPSGSWDPYAGWGRGPGWGLPPSGVPAPPGGPRRPQWVAPLAVLVAVVLVTVGGAAVLYGRSSGKRPAAIPRTVASGAPRRTPPPRRATKAPKQPTAKPARTYSAPPNGVPIRGRVVDAAGRPVPDAAVKISEHEGFAEGFGRALIAITTLGLACLADVCTVPYENGLTDARGEYTVYLQPGAGDYELSAGNESGRVYGGDFDYTGAPMRLPDIVLWTPAPRVTFSGTTARVDFARPPARAGSTLSYGISVTTHDDHDRVVEVEHAHPGSTFDARLVEDGTVDVAVTVRVRTARFGEVTYAAETSGTGHLVPRSRGASCLEYANPRGSASAIRTAPCGLTDGDLDEYWGPRMQKYDCYAADCERGVAVDLGAVRPVRYVVVHGCNWHDSRIETSTDRRTWRKAVSGCSGPVSGSARYVRVVGPGGGFYFSYSELSVY